ncbi:MAG TPA: multicopper oxidase family protein [Usitatibacter sp.]|nr:multicopper oxidase family protein [Usitatibacter sp.]
MSLTRRQFLQTAGAALGSMALPPGARAAAGTPFELRAAISRQAIRDGGPTEVWAFNDACPGPLLRFRRGESVDVLVRNDLPRVTTVHWHGIRVPNAMDGVPHVTQAPIRVGDRFEYKFSVPDAGTYWYHPHQSSFEQVPRGLYGPLIVDEDKPIAVDREEVWVLSDFKLDKKNRPVEDYGKVLDFGSGGRLGNTFTINGTQAGAHRKLQLRPNERVRLRLINAASARIFDLAFGGHEPIVVTYDGQSTQPHPLPGGVLVLGPGQRTDLVIDGTAGPGSFPIMDKRDSGTQVATIAYAGSPVRGKALPMTEPVAPNALAEPDIAKATAHFLVFEGGVLGQPAIARVDGKAMDVKQIMEQHGLTWTMNYTAQHEHAMMHEPLFRFDRGEHATIKMLNHTDFEHPMHLHGHFFKVFALDDKKLERPVWRDTVMIGPRGSCDIAFVADNVGEWMFHCHILDHAAGGMMGTVVVDG